MKLRRHITFFLLVFACIFFSAQASYNVLVYKGDNKFDKKNYEGASSNYLEAIKKNDEDFAAHYNMGNALYKRKMYKEADAEYKRAENLAKTKADKAASIYNQGNVQMQYGDREKAAELYRKSLKVDPYNEAVRKNYEIAMKKDDDKKNQQGQNENNSGGGNKNDKEQGNGNEDGESTQHKAGNGSQNIAQSKGGNQDSSSSMPDDLRKAILNRVENKERETAKRILNKNAYSMPESNEKDW